MFRTPWGDVRIVSGRARLPHHVWDDVRAVRTIAEWALTLLADADKKRQERNACRRRRAAPSSPV